MGTKHLPKLSNHFPPNKSAYLRLKATVSDTYVHVKSIAHIPSRMTGVSPH